MTTLTWPRVTRRALHPFTFPPVPLHDDHFDQAQAVRRALGGAVSVQGSAHKPFPTST